MVVNRLEIGFCCLYAEGIPRVVGMDGGSCSKHIVSLAVDAYAVADSEFTAVLLVVESVVLTVLVAGVVLQTHTAAVVVLVEALYAVSY